FPATQRRRPFRLDPQNDALPFASSCETQRATGSRGRARGLAIRSVSTEPPAAFRYLGKRRELGKECRNRKSQSCSRTLGRCFRKPSCKQCSSRLFPCFRRKIPRRCIA